MTSRRLAVLLRLLAGFSLAAGAWAVAPVPAAAARAKPAAVSPLSHYLVAWGDDAVGQTETPDGISDITAVSAGYNHGLARRTGGTVVAWGANGAGQADVPAGLSDVTAVAAGYNFSLALMSNGTVTAWGDPAYGVTTVPGGLTGVTAVAAGYNHALALKSDRTVVAWGRNVDDEANVPGVLANVIAIAAGRNFSLALVEGGTLVAWGDDSYGQIDVPAGLSNVTAVSAGGDHSLALRSDGTVVAWGDNFYGQAGVPSGLMCVAAVAAGGNFSVALTRPPTLALAGLTSPRLGGTAGTLTVTVRDYTGATDTGHRGTVAFTSTDAQATLPAAYTFTADDAGVHAFSVTLGTAGVQAVTATDTANSLVTGSQSGIVVTYPSTTYHAIAPARVLDSRTSTSNWTNMGLQGPFKAGAVRTFHVANAPYVGGGSAIAVPAGATAVTGNLTVTRQTVAGLVALGPTMTATGEVTTLNFIKGENRANNVTLGLAPDGTLQAVFRAPLDYATAELIFDVTGYFLADASGATLHTLTPGRILDSRPNAPNWKNIGLSGKFKHATVRTLTVAGARGIGWASPQVPVGATAVTGNVTVTNATTEGFVSFGPTLVSVPPTSTVNTQKGKNTANGLTVALNSTGKLQAVWVGTASTSTADVIFDVTGYFTADASGLSFYPVAPYRVLDSVTGKGLAGTFATNAPRLLTVRGTGGAGGVPADATGIAGNLTLVNPSSYGFAHAAPSISGIPTSSTVNSGAHVTVANGFDVALAGTGELALIWSGTAGSTAYLQLDITGYWK